MNIHPIVVHFPIALLTLYSFIEISGLFGRKRTKKLEQTKLFLLFVGTIGTFFALQSGEMAQDYLGMKRSQLIHTHEQFAENSYTIYIIICVYYLLHLARMYGLERKLPNTKTVQLIFGYIENILTRPHLRYVIILLAAVGLMFLTVTGALGGAISQGPDTDPIVRFIYDVLMQNSGS